MARLDRYRIGIPRELSEIRTQPWLSEGSLTCDPYHPGMRFFRNSGILPTSEVILVEIPDPV